jgi:midasin (ATPase involved in ribosome maturation)
MTHEIHEMIQEFVEEVKDIPHFATLSLISSTYSESPDFTAILQALDIISDENYTIFSKHTKKAKEISKKMQDFLGQSSQMFVFKEGAVIEALRNGNWLLLDGVESAPSEVERLMSLFEEIPSLAIWEGIQPIIFYTSGHKPADIDEAEFIEIHPNIRVFITCSNPHDISPALRSRLFCIHVPSASSREELKELCSSVRGDSVLFN